MSKHLNNLNSACILSAVLCFLPFAGGCTRTEPVTNGRAAGAKKQEITASVAYGAEYYVENHGVNPWSIIKDPENPESKKWKKREAEVKHKDFK